MFVPQRFPFAITLILLTLLPLTGCMSGESLEGALKPDPNAGQWRNNTPQVTLPDSFPTELRYQNAALLAVNSEPGANTSTNTPGDNSGGNPTDSLTTTTTVQTRWHSPDSHQMIKEFYLARFQQPGWELLQQESGDGLDTLVARRGNLRVGVAIPNTLGPEAQPSEGVEFAVQYTFGGAKTTANPDSEPGGVTSVPTGSPSPVAISGTPQPGDPNFIGPVLPNSGGATTSVTPGHTPPEAGASGLGTQSFRDLQTAPPQLQSYVQDLGRLGVLSGTTLGSQPGNFSPNQPINRRTFARWLVTVNNRFYHDRPARQIRLASTGTMPVFRDIPASDPDFAYIQGLAAAGFIPSSLTGNNNLTQFRPEAPLTRETLLQWKVPVDLRQSLPVTTVEGVKQAWGFKDVNKIAPEALQAINADYQNGDLANIRRLFGTTLLLQPKQTVTRAEAAAALWYIGVQGDGISAQTSLSAQSPASPTGAATGNSAPARNLATGSTAN